MVLTLVVLGLGCRGPAAPPALPAEQQLRTVIGPVAHAWRDLARAEGDPGAAAAHYRALAAALSGLALTEPADVAWRDLLVAAAERDAAWGEALSQGLPVPQSTLGPISELRSLHLAGAPRGQITASASVLLQDPPWATWDAQLTPWLSTAATALDASPPFDVDAHWGPWLPREANRQLAGLAFAEQGHGPPAGFVARMQRQSGPAAPRGAPGCDLYQDVAGEGGPPHTVPPGPTQARRAGDLLAAVAQDAVPAALAAVSLLVASRDPLCPGAALFEAGLSGRLLLAQGDPLAKARLQQAVATGQALLSALAPAQPE